MEKSEYRAVIKFLTLEGQSPKNIHERMERVYGDMCPPYTTVKNWAQDIRLGRRSIQDEPRSGRPSTATTEENIETVEKLIMEDRRITLDMIAHIMGISHGTVFNIIHEELMMTKICAYWVPKMLRTHEKANRVQIATENLERYRQNPEDFLSRIVTGDETWIYYYDPETSPETLEWRHKSSPRLKQVKQRKSDDKKI